MMYARIVRQHPTRADETEAIDVGALKVLPVFHATSCFMCLFGVAGSDLVRIAAGEEASRLSLLADNEIFGA